MSKYLKYPSYKDSGVEWLGDIPERWVSKKLKYNLALQINKITITHQQVIALENITGWSGELIATGSKYQGDDVEFKNNDVLFGKLRPYLAKVHKCNNSGIAFGDILVYRPTKQVDSKFSFYTMISESFIDIVDGSTYGSKMPRASVDFVSNMFMVTPPLQEQQTIANYLDIATLKIDTLIKKQIKLIELLKEKRQALISTAVTRGLDKTVAMKDSGVEWLGEIPEGWSLPKLSLLSSIIGDGLHGTPIYVESSAFNFINGNNLVDGKIQFKVSTKYVSEQEYLKYKKPLNLTTLLLSINGTIGSMAFYNNESVMLGKSSAYINCINTLLRKYLYYFLQSSQNKQYFDLELTGTTIYNLSLETIRKTPIPLPSLKEQAVISNYLDDKTSKIDTLIIKSTKAIDLLKEKRTALISSAVTGKIDVREAS